MNPDEQEARSRLYSNDIIRILPLKSGRIAVFNSAADLCGVVATIEEATAAWYPPAPPKDALNLNELGLI